MAKRVAYPESAILVAFRTAVAAASWTVVSVFPTTTGGNPIGVVFDQDTTAGAGRMLWEVLRGGPGHTADLRRGDQLLAVDGAAFMPKSLRRALPVRVKIERGGVPHELLVTPLDRAA